MADDRLLNELQSRASLLTAQREAAQRQRREETEQHERCRAGIRALADTIHALNRAEEGARWDGQKVDLAEYMPPIANALREVCRVLRDTGAAERWPRADHNTILERHRRKDWNRAVAALSYDQASYLFSQALAGELVEQELGTLWSPPSPVSPFDWLPIFARELVERQAENEPPQPPALPVESAAARPVAPERKPEVGGQPMQRARGPDPEVQDRNRDIERRRSAGQQWEDIARHYGNVEPSSLQREFRRWKQRQRKGDEPK
jgi:hypothetical protein